MLETAIKAAKNAGIILEKYFETNLQRELKDDASIVTIADKEIEKTIIQTISEVYPDHTFLGEEGGEQNQGSEFTWVIDPIDGTTNFVNGIPLFAISIALVKNNEHVVSVIYNPITETLFSAEKGKGAYCNGSRFNVSDQDAKTGMITIGTSSGAKDKELVRKLFYHAHDYIKSVRYLGSAVIELGYLARGGTEGFVNVGTKKWDYAAGTLLVLEAGGMITDFDGNSWQLDQNYFLASNKIIHPQLLELIKKARGENLH